MLRLTKGDISQRVGIIGIIFAFLIPLIGLLIGLYGLKTIYSSIYSPPIIGHKKPKNKKFFSCSGSILNLIAIVLSILVMLFSSSIFVCYSC